ncbi:FAD-dependent oxidoreductase [Aquimarina sp. U1-2]|uniref:NAD(P)-binding protein n=1 Tax=Aquimarina sp. U1-2 TaxID=2823141 RepID=UPI001AECA470|nr:NAD(P)-binding protein [Aquimarina sp. U1-2]MBP2833803.1 FAD-dependent oxidoreductase [Aquimarina sp. U1-2]
MKKQDKYDVVVIGSGIGGATPAVLLSKYFGKRVLIIEKHWQFGGLTHSFEMDGKSFNAGVHYVGGVTNGSIPDKLFDIITGNRLRWFPLPFRYDHFHFPNFDYAFPASEKLLIEELSRLFPEDAKGIAQYVKDSRKAFRFMAIFISIRSFAPRFLHFLIPIIRSTLGFDPNILAQAYLDKNIKNAKLKSLLGAQWVDHGVIPSEASFMVHSMIFHHYINGAYYPQGGPKSIARGMEETLKSNNVDIRLKTEATQILIKNGKAYGVEVINNTGQKEIILADTVISNTGAVHTYTKLLNQHRFDFIENNKDHLLPRYNFFSIYISLYQNPENLDFDGTNHWVYRNLNHDKDILSPMHPDYPGFYCMLFPSLKAKDMKNHKMEILTMVEYSTFKKWKEQEWKHRDNAYYEEKEKIIQKIFDDIESRHPGFRSMISKYDASTPLTLEKFTSREQGASYGVPYTTHRMKLKWLSNKTPFRNLYLSGQDTFAPGITAAMMGGVGAAAKVLGTMGYLKIMRKVLKHEKVVDNIYHLTQIRKIKEETPDSYTVYFEPIAHLSSYEAGQFIMVSSMHKGVEHKRSYSLSSTLDEQYPSITIKRLKGGFMSNYIKDNLRVGSFLNTSSPKGKFIIPVANYGKNILMIAAGSGITPIFSMLKDTMLNPGG